MSAVSFVQNFLEFCVLSCSEYSIQISYYLLVGVFEREIKRQQNKEISFVSSKRKSFFFCQLYLKFECYLSASSNSIVSSGYMCVTKWRPHVPLEVQHHIRSAKYSLFWKPLSPIPNIFLPKSLCFSAGLFPTGLSIT